MNFQYNYNLHGSDRKPLIEAMSQVLGLHAVYQGAPSFAYTVGDYTVNRNGVLSYNSNIHPDFAAVLINDLQERGFTAEKITVEDAAAEEIAIAELTMEESVTDAEITGETATEENAVGRAEGTVTANTAETAPDADAPTAFTVEIPDAGFTQETLENLKKIIVSKAALLKQALETDDLPITECDGKITFPWFTLHGLDGEADAYNRLVAALCKMAKNQKRVTATEKPAENAKFNMRLFLVRLGFIGDEYKTARKILLRNLTGNSAWKSGHKPEWLAGNIETGTTTTNAGYTDVDVPAEEAPVDIETSEFPEDKNGGGKNHGK
jgi:hypothetical protein